MAERDGCVPVWNSTLNSWEPVDFRHGQRVGAWPAQLDPALLPIPEYSDGDRVQFVRDETCAREGVVRRVLFEWGSSTSPRRQQVATGEALLADNITYIVTARGHDHRIKAYNILGCFVSLDRISRILPLNE